MTTSSLAAVLTLLETLRARLAESEESRDLQRRALGAVLPKTERRLLELRRELRAAALEASRLSRDAGLPEQALELAREFAALDHLVETAELRVSARPA